MDIICNTDEQVRMLFERRYGYPPERIERGTVVVLAGPVRPAGSREADDGES